MNEEHYNQQSEPEAVHDHSEERTDKSSRSMGTPEKDANHMIAPIIGVLVVLLVMVLGGLYLWGSQMQSGPENSIPAIVPERPTIEENNEPESTEAEADVETLDTVSPSDTIEAIEADVESTNLDELDAELDAIEAELDAALEAEL